MSVNDQPYKDLGLKRLSATWAKCEILLGLLAATLGLSAVLSPPEFVGDLGTLGYVCGVVLVVLGTYLALAGHRSHFYQSQNRLFAWLAAKIDGQERGA